MSRVQSRPEMCTMTYSVWPASFVCAMPHVWVAWMFVLYLEESSGGLKCVTKFIYILQVSFVCDMGWLRSVGSIKLYVSFAEYRLFYRALLPIIFSVWQVSFVCDMGWLRSVGSIKLHVSFAEYRLFYRALLQKRPIILSILLTVATPYGSFVWDLPRLCVAWILVLYLEGSKWGLTYVT